MEDRTNNLQIKILTPIHETFVAQWIKGVRNFNLLVRATTKPHTQKMRQSSYLLQVIINYIIKLCLIYLKSFYKISILNIKFVNF